MASLVPASVARSRATPVAHPFLAGGDDDVALVGERGSLTYGELRDRVAQRSALLGADRRLVMLAARRDEETIVSLLAALAGGHPVIMIDGERDAGASETLRAGILAEYDPDTIVSSRDGDARIEHRREASAHEVHPDLAMLLSTSGSTGSPKLVRLSRGNLVSNARSIAEYLSLEPVDRGATTLPLHYCYGLSIITSHLAAGASVLLTDRSVVEPAFWSEVQAARVTSLAGVPHSFDLIEASGARPLKLPALRCITQAGGKLGPERVRRWARESAAHGVDFVVMYGATEATARMAYLPPALAEERPEAIGVAIPGGALRIDAPDDEGCGELVYAGPNVMMGYASSPADLARGPELDELRTGDLARLAPDGLVEIVGRSSRFVKIFGLRVDLDRIESLLADKGIPAHAVEAGDGVLIGSPAFDELECVPGLLASATGLPTRSFRVTMIEGLAVTSSGKPDRAPLRAIAEQTVDSEAMLDAAPTVEGTPADGPPALAEAVRSLYAAVLDRPDATVDDSFVALEGDSLAYVEAVVRLERLVGELPRDWPSLTAEQLGALADERRASAPSRARGVADGQIGREGSAGAPRRASRWSLATLEAPVALRALAIVLIVGTHANLLGLQGGAHVLLAVLGYNLARFQLASVERAARVRSLLRATAMIAVPATLWIGAVGLTTGAYEPTTALLVNSWLGEPAGWASATWSEQWRFWFIEAAVAGALVLALLVAVPALDRLERRRPFALALGAVGLALVVRVAVTGGVTAGAVERYAPPAVLWLLALGWLVARSESRGQRVIASVIAVAGTVGFFGDPQREAVVIAGLLALIWVRAVGLPRILLPIVTAVASASLFVYLVHWELYPLLEDDAPLAATVLSFAAGMLVWAVWRRALRLPRLQRRLAARAARSTSPST
ncbi:MAG: AMP-binding protein [Microcella sp.]|uniref:AMP-binding protein n=1 Tax=Microcella sp. TaxID=1913979 RepID=UPI002720C9EC|nr:AMP-binding protein [Microcella sp.]MDO8337068.1 AMP-binding protein [Microcella sp.]